MHGIRRAPTSQLSWNNCGVYISYDITDGLLHTKSARRARTEEYEFEAVEEQRLQTIRRWQPSKQLRLEPANNRVTVYIVDKADNVRHLTRAVRQSWGIWRIVWMSVQ